MKIYKYLPILFCLLTFHLFGQEIGVKSFEKQATVINKNTPLSSERNKQIGIQINLMLSNRGGVIGNEIRVNYLKESKIPIGIYTAFGGTRLFQYTANGMMIRYGEKDYGWSDLDWTPQEWKNAENIIKSYLYLSGGISKNISDNYTFYLGYGHILGLDNRTEYVLNMPINNKQIIFEENSFIDLGNTIRFKKISINYGIAIHIPYNGGDYGEYQYKTSIINNIRHQFGIGYNL